MSASWSKTGRPLIIVITVALASMTIISSLLVYAGQQNTEAQVRLAALGALRKNLAEETQNASGQMGAKLEIIERSLAAAAGSLGQAGSPLPPSSSVAQEALHQALSSLDAAGGSLLWVDERGVLVYTSAGPDLQGPVGSDLSDLRYYEMPLATGAASVTGAFKDGRGTDYFAISVPITYRQSGSFGGVLAALLPVDSIKGSFLAGDYAQRGVMVVASDGTILSHPLAEIRGRSIQDSEVADLVADELRPAVLSNFRLMTQGRSGVLDYQEKGGEPAIMAYEPVVLHLPPPPSTPSSSASAPSHVWTVAMIEPTRQVDELAAAVRNSEGFTVVAAGLIAAVSGIFIAFILLLNRRLLATVNQQNVQINDQLCQLQQAYHRLKEQDVIKDEFINIAAHELRTPVVSMMLSAENLADLMPGDENVKIILRNANRITKLTNDILDVSRIESNTLKLQRQKTRIKRLVEEVVDDVQFRLPRDLNIRIVVESTLPPEREELEVDRTRIMQVLANMLDNAVNSTDAAGEIRVVLEDDRESSKGYIRVSVIDHGRGIDPSIMPKLFGKFISNSHKGGGTGLGLYLSKAIVEAHGGTMRGENNASGRGATFSFTLPTAAAGTS
jgi:signal transduction histidine kinase